MSEAASDSAASKPIIIAKSIKSLTEEVTPENVTEAKTENKSEEAGVKPVSAASQLSEQEKRELRLKKFGAVTDDSKKEQRAKRFGGADGSKATTGETKSVDPEKLAKRAQRFGGNAVTESTADSNPSKEALENRAKRFGLNNSATNVPDEVLQKRKERFGAAEEDPKKKLRAERFKTTA